MEGPVADRVGGEVPGHLAAGLDDHRMLARRMIAMPRHQLEKMPVNMDRMPHHRVVDEIDAHPLAFDEGDRLVMVRHFFAVERPHEPLHVAGEVNVDAAARRAHVRIAIERHQVPVDKHLVADVGEALAGLAGAVDGHRRDGLDARVALHLRRVREVSHLHRVHRVPAMVHARHLAIGAHRAVVHPAHRGMIHPRMIHACHGAIVHGRHRCRRAGREARGRVLLGRRIDAPHSAARHVHAFHARHRGHVHAHVLHVGERPFA